MLTNGGLSHHQHVKDDYGRKAKDHRPDPDRPKHVFGGKTLWFSKTRRFKKAPRLRKAPRFGKAPRFRKAQRSTEALWLRKCSVLIVHDAPAYFFYRDDDSSRLLKRRSGFRSHLNTGARAD